MSLRAAARCSSVWKINSSRVFSTGRRCTYSQSSFPIDPLVADVLAQASSQVKRRSMAKELLASDSSKAELPPLADWRKYFPNDNQIHHRISIRNPDTASLLADAFVPSGSKDKVVIEAFPGPGQLTRALLELPKSRIKRLIVMEDYEPYLEYLRPLEALDSRLKVVPIPGYDWDSYQTIHDLELLADVSKLPWDGGVHPQLQFISHLPSTVIGEQLIAQLFRSIPAGQWLFQYGRIPMNFILSEYVWKRISATVEDKTMRCKVSVIAEAVAKSTEVLPFQALQPFEDHFHPVRSVYSMNSEKKHDSRRVGNPFQAIKVVPLEHQAIGKGQLDKWDFCLRRLFVRKATALKTALPSLAPGAQILLKKITDPSLPESERFDPKMLIRKMTVQEWSILLKAFDEWPFAPEDLSIGDSFVTREVR